MKITTNPWTQSVSLHKGRDIPLYDAATLPACDGQPTARMIGHIFQTARGRAFLRLHSVPELKHVHIVESKRAALRRAETLLSPL